MLTPAYYDQNGQLVMGGGRSLGTPVNLVSPGPVLVNSPQSALGFSPGFSPSSNLYQATSLGYAPQAYPSGPPTPTFAIAAG